MEAYGWDAEEVFVHRDHRGPSECSTQHDADGGADQPYGDRCEYESRHNRRLRYSQSPQDGNLPGLRLNQPLQAQEDGDAGNHRNHSRDDWIAYTRALSVCAQELDRINS